MVTIRCLLPLMPAHVGLLLLVAPSGCSTTRVADSEPIDCFTENDCPEECECNGDRGYCATDDAFEDACRGTCTRTSCPEGETCRPTAEDSSFYSCQKNPPETCPDAGTIGGTAVDEEGTAIVGMRVFALSPPSGEVTASFSGKTDGQGRYSFAVDGNREYRISSQIVVDTSYMTAEGTETCEVQCDGSVTCSQCEAVDTCVEKPTYDIDAKRGYFLDAELVDSEPVSVVAGEDFTITLSYTIWNRALCEECSPRFIVGFNGIYGDVVELGPGSVHPGLEATDLQVTLTAPDAGSYALYAVFYPGSRSDDASGAPQEFYESRWPDQEALRYIELGELEVQQP